MNSVLKLFALSISIGVDDADDGGIDRAFHIVSVARSNVSTTDACPKIWAEGDLECVFV